MESSVKFQSVLSRPFKWWNLIEDAIAVRIPEWRCAERSKVILALLRFLEIKVLIEEYTKDHHLLAPTPLIRRAWKCLVVHKSKLYRKVLASIQKFHKSPYQYVYLTPPIDTNAAPGAARAMRRTSVQRTQSLFHCYYPEDMPESVTHDAPRGLPRGILNNRNEPDCPSIEVSELSESSSEVAPCSKLSMRLFRWATKKTHKFLQDPVPASSFFKSRKKKTTTTIMYPTTTDLIGSNLCYAGWNSYGGNEEGEIMRRKTVNAKRDDLKLTSTDSIPSMSPSEDDDGIAAEEPSLEKLKDRESMLDLSERVISC